VFVAFRFADFIKSLAKIIGSNQVKYILCRLTHDDSWLSSSSNPNSQDDVQPNEATPKQFPSLPEVLFSQDF